MYWVAIEDADSCEVSEFERATKKDVFYILEGYKADLNSPEFFQLQDTENGKNIIYEGVTYKGGFGFNIWVGRKFLEL